MLSGAIIQQAAQRLNEAEKTGTQISQFSFAYPEITIVDAYEIQEAYIATIVG
ncbi:hypothetical protein [Streptococcus suis]